MRHLLLLSVLLLFFGCAERVEKVAIREAVVDAAHDSAYAIVHTASVLEDENGVMFGMEELTTILYYFDLTTRTYGIINEFDGPVRMGCNGSGSQLVMIDTAGQYFILKRDLSRHYLEEGVIKARISPGDANVLAYIAFNDSGGRDTLGMDLTDYSPVPMNVFESEPTGSDYDEFEKVWMGSQYKNRHIKILVGNTQVKIHKDSSALDSAYLWIPDLSP